MSKDILRQNRKGQVLVRREITRWFNGPVLVARGFIVLRHRAAPVGEMFQGSGLCGPIFNCLRPVARSPHSLAMSPTPAPVLPTLATTLRLRSLFDCLQHPCMDTSKNVWQMTRLELSRRSAILE
ncbi:hypothetical protein B0H16DRAFT_1464335 [Mycena metata]|uniref:Uncharacterized protein n=1 Tax=Mycena metata TaxID=1033252 RepID=A0AAD7N2T1_9AGAR|nr:hypothetical protein B0H16DRAFT_1464335 [Mycena metata]